MNGRDEMRAADVDREAVAERLRLALNEGRLGLDEYDDRLRRAYDARTYGELNALTTDLPGTVPLERSAVVPAASAEVVTPTSISGPAVGGGMGPWLFDVWGTWLRVTAIVVAIWLVTSALTTDLLYFWPGWVIGPWGAVLAVRTVTGIAKGEPQRWRSERKGKGKGKKSGKRNR
ncbi:DUF1707 domain-containing protein [Micromonospora sp. CPCC 206060]|uniref:DUF1707 domain-containing protein n=1 Tax=Micromonospora sp. CPCC 206060 TaxID=3122406 RepID=UPI002FF43BDD